MKSFTKVFISMIALNTFAESKLVVYGPQALIDFFNQKVIESESVDGKGSTSTTKSHSK